ncbi:hypothetical protein Tco_0880130 [Tanacetum coccineum]
MKQKVEEDKEYEELKQCLEIIPNDGDDVTIDATPLSTKSPTIVDYKIYQKGKKSYFQIIRADGKTQMYLTFVKMLKNFNREDLEVLWSIVKARFKKTEPVNYMDTLSLHNLKTMFEHHVEDNVWKNQQGLVKVLNWKLYDYCGVHCVTMQSMIFYLLVEKIYPLTNHTLHQMFNDVKLQVDYECEMVIELLRLVKKHLKGGYGRIVGIKILLDDLRATAAKLLLLVYVSTARVKLVLLEKIEENILSDGGRGGGKGGGGGGGKSGGGGGSKGDGGGGKCGGGSTRGGGGSSGKSGGGSGSMKASDGDVSSRKYYRYIGSLTTPYVPKMLLGQLLIR